MLRSHLRSAESLLLAASTGAGIAGHPNLRGSPREWFVSNFLERHLPANLEISQGEIIDRNSSPSPSPNEYRPQVDVVLYRRDLPKIEYSPKNCAFLVEGVMATIEVKSRLTKEECLKCCSTSVVHKSLQRDMGTIGMGSGWRPKHIVTYLVAYGGPASCETVASWLHESAKATSAEKLIDFCAVFGGGVIWRREAFPAIQVDAPPEQAWAWANQKTDNLMLLFLHLLSWMTWSTTPPNMLGYARETTINDVHTI